MSASDFNFHRCTCSWPFLPTDQKCATCKAAGITLESQRLRVTETVTEIPRNTVTRRGRPAKPDALTPAERARRYRQRKAHAEVSA